jgi:hypothetical protein
MNRKTAVFVVGPIGFGLPGCLFTLPDLWARISGKPFSALLLTKAGLTVLVVSVTVWYVAGAIFAWLAWTAFRPPRRP